MYAQESRNASLGYQDEVPPQVLHTTKTVINKGLALVVEDIRQIHPVLESYGYEVERLTHAELHSIHGDAYTTRLVADEYRVLWITTPSDWYVRIMNAKAIAHYKRLCLWIRKAIDLKMTVVLFGPPGFFWNLDEIKEIFDKQSLHRTRMRLCSGHDKFDKMQTQPSGSYLQVATNRAIRHRWKCQCGLSIGQHKLDWYGRHPDKAAWRRKIYKKYSMAVCEQLFKGDGNSSSLITVPLPLPPWYPRYPPTQTKSTPLPTTTLPTVLTPPKYPPPPRARYQLSTPTEVRTKDLIRRLKESSDCGEDLRGLGPEVKTLACDIDVEDMSDDDEPVQYLSVPYVRTNDHNIFSITSELCYGRNNRVDLIELCGGQGRISTVAFRRGLASGGNLDLVTGCDLGDPKVQEAVNHYLDTCYVLCAVLQPNCRSTGSFSHYNRVHNYNAWHKHHVEDLPHIRYCGHVALRQAKHERYWIREQPSGTTIDDIEPWPAVWKYGNTVGIIIDQCAAGAVDSHQMPVQKPTEMTANEETLLRPLERMKCNRQHEHGTPTGKALERMRVYPWPLCTAIVKGILMLKTKLKRHARAHSYPSVGVGPDETMESGDAAETLPGSRDAASSTDVRVGAHPRDPRPKARTHPTADTSSSDAIARAEVPSASSRLELPEWTRFHTQISLRNLGSYVPEVVEKELRKLHIRWWHATEATMRRLLYAAGLDEVRLALIKSVVERCRECRGWKLRESKPSPTIGTQFLQHGEMDVIQYKDKYALHVIDQCIRFSAGCVLTNQGATDILDAFWDCWFKHHGPFQTLHVDKACLCLPEMKTAMKRLGTTLIQNPDGQMNELALMRQGIIKHVIYEMELELRAKYAPSFGRLFTEALFVVNAFTFHNQVSPYYSLAGIQPPYTADIGDRSKSAEHNAIRAAALSALSKATNVYRENSQRREAAGAEPIKYQRGDLIDVYTPPLAEEKHGGWGGPFSVVNDHPIIKEVTIQKAGKPMKIKHDDTRLTLFMDALWIGYQTHDNEAMAIVLSYIEGLPMDKAPETFGYVKAQGSLALTSISRRQPRVLMALQYVIRSYFRLYDVYAVRIGRGRYKLTGCTDAMTSILIHYSDKSQPHFRKFVSKESVVDVAQATGISTSRYMQCLCNKSQPNMLEEIPNTLEEAGIRMTPAATSAIREDHPIPPPANDSPPGNIQVGDLPTIEEGDEADELMIQAYYADIVTKGFPDSDLGEQYWQKTPVRLVKPDHVLFMVGEESCQGHSAVYLDECEVSLQTSDDNNISHISPDCDEVGEYVELQFTPGMSPVILTKEQNHLIRPDQLATLRVYISANIKRAVVIKDDDLLTKKEIEANAAEVATATVQELKIWLDNKCFEKCLYKNAQNIMTSRYVVKWKWVQQPDGTWKKIIRMRLCLRGFMDTEAFSLDTFSGTAKRTSQRIIASEAACHPDYIIASLDIDKAFLKGYTYEELANATGEKERTVCFRLPPGSAAYLRKFPGFEDFDETRHCLRCIKPGTGTKDAPRAFSLKLREITKLHGMYSTAYDPELEIGENLLTGKHVDDVNIAGTEKAVDHYTGIVEGVFGKCKLHKNHYTNCGVRYIKQPNGDVTLDQDEYIKTLRPIASPEFTGTDSASDATKTVTDMFVSLRGALAYTTLTQAWIQVYIVALQRVQQPTNGDVRRLNCVTRVLQKNPKTLRFPAMTCKDELDAHVDSGYKRIIKGKHEAGYGMRGMCLLRRGIGRDKKSQVVHLLDSICKSHKLTVRSGFASETLAVAHGVDDAYPSVITLEELRHGVKDPVSLKNVRELGGLQLTTALTTDEVEVFTALCDDKLKAPTEQTLLGHVCWIREMLSLGLISRLQLCNRNDMVADGHTRGIVSRQLLLEAMSGKQTFRHEVKKHLPTTQTK